MEMPINVATLTKDTRFHRGQSSIVVTFSARTSPNCEKHCDGFHPIESNGFPMNCRLELLKCLYDRCRCNRGPSELTNLGF
jgi:hypothetical protein